MSREAEAATACQPDPGEDPARPEDHWRSAREAPELPWLGDIDRRADDDVEFCVEGEEPDDEDQL